MSPARSHVEQSRNTLFFASCAKEVVTNAQVNVVVSDKALVKQLQRELARLESELRSSGQTPGTSCSSSLIREKDLQIEKLKEELRELTLERDHAQSQIKDLLKIVEEDKPLISSTTLDDYYPKLRVRSTWDLENHTSETTVIRNSHILGGRAGSFDASQYSDGHSSRSDDNFIQIVEFENNSPQYKSPPRSSASALIDNEQQHKEEMEELSCDESEEICKEVRCIEMEESSTNRYLVPTMSESSPEKYIDSITSSPMADIETSVLTVAENGERKRCDLELSPSKEDNKFKNFSPLYGIPSPEKPSPWMMEKGICSSGGLKLTRSRSCKATLMRTFSVESIKEIQGTPPIWFEKDFTGRPEGFQKKLASLKYDAEAKKLSRNCSQTSMINASMDQLKGQNVDVLEDKKNDGINISVAEPGVKQEIKIESEDQQLLEATKQISNLSIESENELRDAMVPETKSKSVEASKIVEDIGMDPLQTDTQSASKWPSEFKSLQNNIIELWHACNVSLIHRTYFFLLFKGDPADSIYMEVEFRRLSFLRHTFSQGNPTLEDGRILTPALSMKALRRERQMLSKQMMKRLSKRERETLFVEWGIGLKSNHRRLQLAHLLWNDTKDMDHIRSSATIVAKLVNYVEPNQAFKEMFGLNFTPRPTHRGSPRWAWRSKHEPQLLF